MKKTFYIIALFALIALIMEAGPVSAKESIIITEQPGDISIVSAKLVTIHVKAEGEGLSYQWYKKKKTDAGWEKWSGKTSAECTVCTGTTMDGMQYRCLITDKYKNQMYSDTGKITIVPQNVCNNIYVFEKGDAFWYNNLKHYTSKGVVKGYVNQMAVCESKMSGYNLQYQWYYKENGKWKAFRNETGSSIRFQLEKKQDGMEVKCVGTAENGLTVESGAISFIVEEDPAKKCKKVVDLYFLDKNLWPDLSIPSNYMTSYDPEGRIITIISGEISFNENGDAVPKYTTAYKHYSKTSGMWIDTSKPTGMEGEIEYRKYICDDVILRIDNKDYVKLRIFNYAYAYAVSIIDRYMKDQIRDGMTDYEKAELCCKFVAGYDYIAGISSGEEMVLRGGGDCWASTEILLHMLDKLGIECRGHSEDTTHTNVVADLDGQKYILEAGIDEKAPRAYFITKYSDVDGFMYTIKEDSTVTIQSYYSQDRDKTIVVPEMIEGHEVTTIGEDAFRNRPYLEKVVLPDTITRLEKNAFIYCFNLTDINIPDGVVEIGDSCFFGNRALKSISIPAATTQIGNGAFWHCTALEQINIESGNPVYCSMDGVVFDKQCTTLLIYPAGKKVDLYKVPDSVQILAEGAFYESAVKECVLPDSLREIRTWAFILCNLSELVIPDSVEVLEERAFYEGTVDSLILPDAMTEIREYVFYQSHIKEIHLPENLHKIGDYAFAESDFTYGRIVIPASVTSIGDYAFNFHPSYLFGGENGAQVDSILMFEGADSISFGENAITNFVVAGKENSGAQKYADSHHLKFLPVDQNGKIVLNNQWFSKNDSTSRGMNGMVCFDAKRAGIDLSEGLDYTFEYDQSNYKLHVVGRGFFQADDIIYSCRLKKPVITSIKRQKKGKGVDIIWKPVKGAVRYRIFKKTGNGKWVKWKDTDSHSVTDKKIKIGVTYHYSVRCISEDGKVYLSPFDRQGKSYTGYKLSVPKVRARVVGDRVLVEWDKVPGATGYVIYFRDPGYNWFPDQKVGPNVTSCYCPQYIKSKGMYYAVAAIYGDETGEKGVSEFVPY